MMIPKIIIVLAEHKIGDVDRQARVPYVTEAPHQNSDHLAEPPKWKTKSSSEEEGCLAERIGRSGPEIAPLHKKIRDLNARLDAINTGAGVPVTVDALIKQTEPLFTRRVMRARVSSKFKLPTQLGVYEGKMDPMDHLNSYKSLMSLQGCSNEVMCKAFSTTSAMSWFRKLSPGSVDLFGDLSRLFVANFMNCQVR